jgi:hypothetical protein
MQIGFYQEKTRDAGFPAFSTLAFRPRGADEAKRRNAAEE